MSHLMIVSNLKDTGFIVCEVALIYKNVYIKIVNCMEQS